MELWGQVVVGSSQPAWTKVWDSRGAALGLFPRSCHRHCAHFCHPEAALSPPSSFAPFFFLFCGPLVPGQQVSDLQQHSPLCLHSPAFSKYSHSSDASSFLIFSILYLFILKSSFVAAHRGLGNCGGRLLPRRVGRGHQGSIFHSPPLVTFLRTEAAQGGLGGPGGGPSPEMWKFCCNLET